MNKKRLDILNELAVFGLNKAAIFRGDKLESFMKSLIGNVNFDELGRDFIVATTDANTGELIMLSEGSVAKALRASMSCQGSLHPPLLRVENY